MRAGHTEACCDLMQLAGLNPAAVLCEIMNDDGTMARLPDLEKFSVAHGLRIGAIADLIQHRSRTEKLVERIAERPLTTQAGAFRLVVYRDKLTDATHLALVRGPISPDTETLVRVHEPLSVIDLLDAESDSPSWSILEAQRAIAAAGRGVIVLLRRAEGAPALRRRAPPKSDRARQSVERRPQASQRMRRDCLRSGTARLRRRSATPNRPGLLSARPRRNRRPGRNHRSPRRCNDR